MKGSKRVARSGDVEVPDDEESSEDWMIGVDGLGVDPTKKIGANNVSGAIQPH